jgi:two-component system response regulator PilR (NtrC family)
MASPRILIIDDEEAICFAFCRSLAKRGYELRAASNAADARHLLREWRPALLFLDLRLGDSDGMDLLKEFKSEQPDLPVVMMTAYGSLELVSQAMACGALDYLTKPLDMDRVHALVAELFASHADADAAVEPEGGFVGSSPLMQDLFSQLLRMAALDAPVLLCGETGTGKDLAARLLHARSARRDKPFVAVNCGALPDKLVESELFGHCKGSFTGATEDKIGRCEAAHGGVLFLDEISELSLPAQVKLLRFLDHGVVERLGASRSGKVDVRVIAASNRDVPAAVATGQFRADLFYRLAVLQLRTPPLREHPEDIPALAQHILRQINPRLRLAADSVSALQAQAWPGNVRELRNALYQAATRARGDLITPANLALATASELDAASSSAALLADYAESVELTGGTAMKDATDALQRQLIERALREADGNQTQAAAKLGLHRNSLRRLMDELCR